MLRPRPSVIAHRGASAYRPENTLAAFDLALAMGADFLEFDVRATRDGALVLLHDATLARTAGHPAAIAELAAADLGCIDPRVRPPLLEDVLDRYGGRARFLIELKDPSARHDGRVIESIGSRGLHGDVIVQSFDHLALARIARRDASLALVALIAEGIDAHAALDALPACVTGVGARSSYVDAGLVRATRMRGLSLRAWTVNTDAEAERLTGLGVDGIITDVPDRVRATIARGLAAAAA